MTFRIARHTNNLERITRFYKEVLGLKLLGEFSDHAGYNGVCLGLTKTNWHLEFTKSDDMPDHRYDEDDILVFYPSSESEYQEYIDRIKDHNIEKIVPRNPYWKENGVMIQDPDGYRIVISFFKLKRC